MTDPHLEKNALTIRRLINAPRQRVFDAWTEPEHLKNWWHTDPNWSAEIVEVDFRVNGTYRLGMRDPQQDAPFVCGGRFVEIDPPSKVAYTWAWESSGMDVGETLVTVEFIDKGPATELVLTHDRFPNAEAAAEHSKGWTGCINVFVGHVESH